MRRMLLAIIMAVASCGPALADVYVKGHYRSDGTYVQPHYRTEPDKSLNNNWSTQRNTNPYTLKPGEKPRRDFEPYQSPHARTTNLGSALPARSGSMGCSPPTCYDLSEPRQAACSPPTCYDFSKPRPIAVAAVQTVNAATLEMCGANRRDNCVVDGDTVWFNGEKMRLKNVDTPETHAKICGGSYEVDLGKRAASRLLALLNGGQISIDRHGLDPYDRRLVNIASNGQDVGEVLVREQLAREWPDGNEWWCR